MIPIFFYVNPENKIDSQSYLDELDKPLQPSSPPRHSSSHPTNHHTLDKHWPRTGLWSWATVRSNATTHTEEYNNGNPLQFRRSGEPHGRNVAPIIDFGNRALRILMLCGMLLACNVHEDIRSATKLDSCTSSAYIFHRFRGWEQNVMWFCRHRYNTNHLCW